MLLLVWMKNGSSINHIRQQSGKHGAASNRPLGRLPDGWLVCNSAGRKEQLHTDFYTNFLH